MSEMCECGVILDAHPPLPRPGPLRSWKSQRPVKVAFGNVTERRWSDIEFARRIEAADRRTEREREVLRIVEKNGGNKHAAARELGVAPATVFATVKRARR